MKVKTYHEARKAAIKLAKETMKDTYVTVSCFGGYYVEQIEHGGECFTIRANA